MDIEKAKEVLKNMDIDYMGSSICKECCFENDHKCFDDTNGDCQMIAINTILNELDKKDKIINEMANNIADSSNVYENLVNTEFQHTAEEVIDYFTKKAEG